MKSIYSLLTSPNSKGASFTLEQERLNDEIWLPSLADINLPVRAFMVKGIDVKPGDLLVRLSKIRH